jgi:hypothetical protein
LTAAASAKISKAHRNPYVRGRRACVLDADLAKAFPDA